MLLLLLLSINSCSCSEQPFPLHLLACVLAELLLQTPEQVLPYDPVLLRSNAERDVLLRHRLHRRAKGGEVVAVLSVGKDGVGKGDGLPLGENTFSYLWQILRIHYKRERLLIAKKKA